MQTQLPSQPVFLNLEYVFAVVGNWLAKVFSFIASGHFYATLRFWVSVLVVLLITSILYSLVRLYEIKIENDKKKIKALALSPAGVAVSLPSATGVVVTAEGRRNPVWENIRSKLLSENPGDWRLGIIEADIYLEKVLDEKGFYGDTLGDKLKQMPTGDLPSLSLAWEAHKVRNRVAHEGDAYTLTMPEARRVLSYFEIVFRDLEVIE